MEERTETGRTILGLFTVVYLTVCDRHGKAKKNANPIVQILATNLREGMRDLVIIDRDGDIALNR
ncbi:hypothetical protein C7B77_17655 [Chamaesiphon polymorphus CCALA 037]|uniref:Uncharacterized protein n=1 Tax=Chamaesiphon polymorphus CCALA 037 TaxID=2107692 RepID=A0A2T1GBK4_9CYAN|nr:hypothetical protein C7B77_17655 [Chamaesiphon polymorphus CCALA 037]